MRNDGSDMMETEVWRDIRQELDRIEIPLEKLDAAVQRGMQEARRRRYRMRRTRIGATAASLLLLASLLSIRYSPVVAAYAEDVLGLETVVHWIRGDKGIELAIANDFMQPIGLSEEHGNVKLTIDGLIADESRMVIFYTIEDSRNHPDQANVLGVDITDIDGQELHSYGIGFSSVDYEPTAKDGRSLGRSTIDVTFQEGIRLPEGIKLSMKLETEEQAVSTQPLWNFSIPIDHSKFEGLQEVITIDQTVTIEGQRISFGEMTILPTRIALEVEYDPNNTKSVFGFDDLEIVDEAGNVFGTIANGVSGSYLDDHHHILYFQSNYFMKPKELYLRASSLRALDKDKLEVLVDLDNKALLTSPDDRMSLVDVAEEHGELVLRFRFVNSDPLDSMRSYFIFTNKFRDAAGNEHESNRSGTSTEDSMEEMQYYIPKGSYASPISLEIVNYPTRIEGDILLRIQ